MARLSVPGPRDVFVTIHPRPRDARPRCFPASGSPCHLRSRTVPARPSRRLIAVAACLLSALPLIARAQVPNIRVAGRVQVQFRAAGGDSTAAFPGTGVNNGFEDRRLRLQADVRFGDNMTLAIQPSFEMGALRMRDAYLRVGLTPQFGVTLGQEKSPFQRYELNSS